MKLKIYQIDREKDKELVKFCDLAETKASCGEINPGIYSKVFDGTVECETTEDVFTKFNIDMPVAHLGHSLSVSDVLEADGEFYFCDSVGFEKIDFDISKVDLSDQIRVLIVEPDKEPYEAMIKNNFMSYQRLVGGLIDCTYIDDKSVIYVNDEGKITGLPGNRKLDNGDIIAGTFVITGDSNDGESTSLTSEQIDEYTARFKTPEQYTSQDVEDTCFMRLISF